MMESYSDTESTFSVDSLEAGGTSEICAMRDNRENDNVKQRLVKCEDMTIPYYKGEISVGEIRLNVDQRSQSANLTNTSKRSITCSKESVSKNVSDHPTSYFWNNAPSRPAIERQRISRRKCIIEANKNIMRSRHRSVSYLEQFRKRLYGTTDRDSSNYSTAGSDSFDRDNNLSFISCLSGESRIDTSELEFYDDLINNLNNEQFTEKSESLKSSTLLTENSTKATNSELKPTSKKKPIVLSKVNVVKPDQHTTELSKKSSIEKRERYANKVKLRNQFKIYLQKEKEKFNKFKESSLPQNITKEDCFLQSQSKDVYNVTSDRKSAIPFSLNVTNLELESKNKIKTSKNKPFRKTHGGENHQRSNIQKEKNVSQLSRLQERHELEKSLIDSMRNLILKT